MNFKPEEYWTLELEIKKSRKKFIAKYVGYFENDAVKYTITVNGNTSPEYTITIEGAA